MIRAGSLEGHGLVYQNVSTWPCRFVLHAIARNNASQGLRNPREVEKFTLACYYISQKLLDGTLTLAYNSESRV